jgi:hypothetical protein
MSSLTGYGFLRHFVPIVALIGFCALPGLAGTFSFVGTFTHDNDVQFFNFSLLSGGTVTLQTLGYGGSANNTGGTNAAGQVILRGGFEPILQVFNAATGNLEGSPFQGTGGPCGLLTPDPTRDNTCLDVFAQIALAAGNYILALTQNANLANGPNLSDGFFFVDTVPDPNFNNGFVGPTTTLPGNGHWAVDILGADRASIPGSVPEPASVVSTGAALAMLGLIVQKIRRA